jgi:hypothetical protein
MSSLKAKIVRQLDYLPDNVLQQVFDFIEFLTWRKAEYSKEQPTIVEQNSDIERDTAWMATDLSSLGEYEPYEWESGELDEGLPIKIDSNQRVVIIEE